MPACVARSTGNITLASTQVIDGIAVGTTEERVLVGEQTDPTENGIYISANSSWIRATDFDGSRDAIPGTIVYVDRGTLYPATFWAFNSSSTDTRIVIGTDNVSVDQVTVALAGVSVYSQSLLGLTSQSAWQSTDGLDVQPDVITTLGDLIVGSSDGTAEQKAKGSFGSILVTSSTTLEWLSAGSSGQLLTIQSSQPTWAAPAAELTALPRGYIDGFILSNSTVDAAHDIIVTAGQARSNTNTFNIDSTTSLTKAIDSSWVSGVGGGLDTGTVAVDTWYYAFAISRSDTSAVDAIFSTASSGPTFPSTAWDEARSLGAVLTDSTANIIAFTQYRDHFQWNDPPQDLALQPASTDKTTFDVTVPPGYRVEAHFVVSVSDPGTANAFFGGENQTNVDRVPNSTDSDLRTSAGGTQGTMGYIKIVNNGQASYKFDDPAGTVLLYTNGWWDPRGRDL